MRVALSALALVLVAGTKNRLRSQLRRVRNPRYLVATALGLLYWIFYFGPLLFGARRPGPFVDAGPGGGARLVELGMTGMGVLFVAFQWLFGSDKAVVTFSDAEIQFLFPAPVSRRALLHYRLLRALAASLLGAAFTALVLGRISGRPLLFTVGAWVAFSILSFHGVAAALTRASLAEHGLSGARRRVLTLAGLAAAVALLAWAVRRIAPPGPFEPTAAWVESLADAIDASPLAVVLWPVRTPVRLVLARTAGDFAAALPGALLLLVLHYGWVLSSAVQFEEASLEAAEKRARRVEALREGRGEPAFRPGKARRPPFALGAEGGAEVAFLWKGLIAGGRTFSGRRLLAAGAGVALAAGILAGQGSEGVRGGLGVLAVTVWAMAVLLGPRMLHSDLRLDLKNLEALKALPLAGARIVRGELLAPAATLAVVQWLLLPFAAAGLATLGEGGDPATAAAIAAAAALGGPAISLTLLTIQNGFVVLLPGWSSAADRPRGPEALGMNILVSLANLLALGLAMLPALVAGGALAFGLAPLAGAAAATVGAAAAGALVLAGECWLATAALGRVFERVDVTET